jgi:hypothetical protein
VEGSGMQILSIFPILQLFYRFGVAAKSGAWGITPTAGFFVGFLNSLTEWVNGFILTLKRLLVGNSH